MTRRNSYVPDVELENKVQEILDQDKKHHLTRIQEDVEEEENLVSSYDVSKIEPRRMHTYRTSITINVSQGTGTSRGRRPCSGRRTFRQENSMPQN